VSENATELYPVALPDLEKKLVLTYDSGVMHDGVGAQLQRNYGTYAIARLLGVIYLHSPLSRVDYQGLTALKKNFIDPQFHSEFNDLFQFRSDLMPSDEFYELNLQDISIDTVNRLVAKFDQNAQGGRPYLVQLVLPYGIADRFPDCYEVCKGLSPFTLTAREGHALRVAIHVRRGDLLVVDSDRMLPNAYYIQVAQNVASTLSVLKVDFQLELYTEVPYEEFVVQPEHHGISHRISAPVVVHPEMNRMDDFSVLPNLVHCINGRAVDCLRGLATADILVMSRSSLSYLGESSTGTASCCTTRFGTRRSPRG